MSIHSVESRNLTVTNLVANEVAIGCQDKDEQVATLLRKICFSEKKFAASERCTRNQSNSGMVRTSKRKTDIFKAP